MEFKVWLLTNEAEKISGLMKRRLDVAVGELGSVKWELEAKEASLKPELHECSRLQLVIGAARAVIDRKKRVIHNFPSRYVPSTPRWCAHSDRAIAIVLMM